MKPIRTKKQIERAKRNEKIQADYDMLTKINGSSKWGVVEYVARKHKVSTATVLRCLE
jgi:hypothetical protein